MPAFTSSLSAAEFALLRESGFRPLRQVTGTCVYYLGFAPVWQSRGSNGVSVWPGYPNAGYIEIESLTRAWNEARGLALSRLADHAAAVGADVVVATRFSRSAYDWQSGLMEFSAIGTAMRSTTYEVDGGPVLTNLSGQELGQLVKYAYWPVGLIAETTVTNVLAGYRTSAVYARPSLKWTNQELPDLSRGPYEARRNVNRRITETAAALGASGMIGIRYDQRIDQAETTHNLLITLHVLGTAIVEVSAQKDETTTALTLSLNDEPYGVNHQTTPIAPTAPTGVTDRYQRLGRQVAGRLAARRRR